MVLKKWICIKRKYNTGLENEKNLISHKKILVVNENK